MEAERGWTEGEGSRSVAVLQDMLGTGDSVSCSSNAGLSSVKQSPKTIIFQKQIGI